MLLKSLACEVVAQALPSVSAMADHKRAIEENDAEELEDLLRAAKRRVQQLEKLKNTMRQDCEHVLVKTYPSGMRDNNEFWFCCPKCRRQF